MHQTFSIFASLVQEDYGTYPMFSSGFLLFILAIAVVAIAGTWKMFAKAGQPGWAAIIPIYNLIVLLRIVGKPLWWLLLFIVPLVNFVIFCIVMSELAKRFGQGMGFVIGLILFNPIFMAILGFGSAVYTPPSRSAA